MLRKHVGCYWTIQYVLCEFLILKAAKKLRRLIWKDLRMMSKRLSKSRINGPSLFSLYCMKGKVGLPRMQLAPQILQDLHVQNNAKGKYFRNNIRVFNNMFRFTSMAGKIDHNINNGRAPTIFKLGGQNYHSLGSLLLIENRKLRLAQLYIHDTENEVSNRIHALRNGLDVNMVDREIVADLKSMLDENNMLAKSFRFARERFREGNFAEVKLKLIRKRNTDGRRYNLPTASEIVALIVGDIDENLIDREVVIETQSRSLHKIDVLHPMYLSLQYPLLFPYEEDGYMPDIELNLDNSIENNENEVDHVSPKQYFAFRI